MQEDIRLIDLVIEILDARAPQSSRNPDIDELAKNKARLVLMNKADLADAQQNQAWCAYFREQGIHAAAVNARSGSGLKKIQETIREACREKIERDRKRGIKNRPVRAMVVGIPNAGKSTFINSLAGKACAKTGDRPGVTKGKQWIRLNKEVELLDTPGILWPKFEDQMTGLRLAVIGSIREEILQPEELALWLIGYLRNAYAGVLGTRYRLAEEGSDLELLSGIAAARGSLQKGGLPDYPRAAALLLEDFRSGRLGRVTLEQQMPAISDNKPAGKGLIESGECK